MRLFIAINIPREIQEYFFDVQSELRDTRLTSSFHLTLKFLGEISNPEKIVEKLEKIKFEKFELTTSQVGVFPNKKHIKVIWVGIEDQEILTKLVDDIDFYLNTKRDYKFHPHITLARVNKKIDFPELKLEPKTFLVEEFLLYQSILTRQGPNYKIIKRFRSK